jgi:hypothetical protein
MQRIKHSFQQVENRQDQNQPSHASPYGTKCQQPMAILPVLEQ